MQKYFNPSDPSFPNICVSRGPSLGQYQKFQSVLVVQRVWRKIVYNSTLIVITKIIVLSYLKYSSCLRARCMCVKFKPMLSKYVNIWMGLQAVLNDPLCSRIRVLFLKVKIALLMAIFRKILVDWITGKRIWDYVVSFHIDERGWMRYIFFIMSCWWFIRFELTIVQTSRRSSWIY